MCMLFTKIQKMITTVNKDLYINRVKFKYVGETTACH